MRAIKNCNILDDPADAFIYSTNILLNCTGGVGGALMARYGEQFQTGLHEILRRRGTQFAAQGEAIDFAPVGLPYRHLIHTTSCDAMYDTTPSIIDGVLSRALAYCAADTAVGEVVVSALATGYGHLGIQDYLAVASRVFHDSRFASLRDIVLCIEDEFTFRVACEINQEHGLHLQTAAEPSVGGSAATPRGSG